MLLIMMHAECCMLDADADADADAANATAIAPPTPRPKLRCRCGGGGCGASFFRRDASFQQGVRSIIRRDPRRLPESDVVRASW